MPVVRVRKTLAAAILLLATAMAPELVWAGAHWLQHHEHGVEAYSARGLAEILVHGHEHQEGTPDHEHRLLPAPSLRPDPPRELQTPAIASLEAPGVERSALSSLQPRPEGTGLSGPSPPRLHLLCTLLI